MAPTDAGKAPAVVAADRAPGEARVSGSASLGTASAQVVSPRRASLKATSFSSNFPGLDECLDEDGALWDTLIDVGSLGTEWEKLNKRVRELEMAPKANQNAIAERVRKQLQASIDKRFEELSKTVASLFPRVSHVESLEPRLGACDLQLQILSERADKHDQDLEAVGAQVRLAQEDIRERQQEIQAVDAALQAKDAAIRAELKDRAEAIVAVVDQDRAGAQAAAAELQSQLDALPPQIEQRRIETEAVVQQMLPALRSELTAEHRQYSEKLVQPIVPHLTAMMLKHGERIDTQIQELNKNHKIAERRVNGLERRFADEVRGLKEVKATVTFVEHIDEEIQRKLGKQSLDFLSLTETVSEKFKELVENLNVLQSGFSGHEHTLQHHAEELLGRCTKYDILMCQEEVKRRVTEQRLRQAMMRTEAAFLWQVDILDKLAHTLTVNGIRIKFDTTGLTVMEDPRGGAAQDHADDNDGDEASKPGGAEPDGGEQSNGEDEGSRPGSTRGASSPASPRGCAFPQPPIAGAGFTELYHQLRQQQERLAQALLGLGHVTIKSVNPTLSRDLRQECEAQLMHHLGCLLHWITHQSMPSGWQPEKLELLACSALVNDDNRVVELQRLAGYRAPEKTWVSGRGGAWPAGTPRTSTSLVEASGRLSPFNSLMDSSVDTVSGIAAATLVKGSLVQGRPPQRRPASSMAASSLSDLGGAKVGAASTASRRQKSVLPTLAPPYVQLPAQQPPVTAR